MNIRASQVQQEEFTPDRDSVAEAWQYFVRIHAARDDAHRPLNVLEALGQLVKD